MKKIIFSDKWGQIVEYVRYRGKHGQFVTDKYGKRAIKTKDYITSNTEQWRISGGKRIAKIYMQRPNLLMKTTYPGAVGDYNGHIWDSIRSTNLFTEIHKAERALIHVTGQNQRGERVRMQSELEVGSRHQSEQLAFAIRTMLENEGYRTNYDLKLIKMSERVRRKARKLDPLLDVQFTVTLFQ